AFLSRPLPMPSIRRSKRWVASAGIHRACSPGWSADSDQDGATSLRTPIEGREEMVKMSHRTGGQILVDQLIAQGVDRLTCVPGESYLAVLDELYDASIDVLVCRNEGGAAMMADAYGKLTGRPGVCFVTRGPGATNASPGVHIAAQDSTPMILFIGQVARHMREREAFQEVNYKQFFGGMAKWVVEVDDPERLPELVARAFRVAMQGRPGPVVVA